VVDSRPTTGRAVSSCSQSEGFPIDSNLPERIAFLGGYLPRLCGIATFTYDLATTVGEREIVALHPAGEPGPYPAEVRHRIRRDVQADYAYAAYALNDCGVNVVSLQHGQGIWGGEDGEFVLDFARALRVPMVVTLHEVPGQPTPAQRSILTELVDLAAATVVMSHSAAAEMARAYGVTPDRLDIVPHGVPHLPQVAADTIKPRLGLQGRAVVLSFGLMEPAKGCESVIEAMPEVIEAVPSACYVILGATEPNCLAREGDEGMRLRVPPCGERGRAVRHRAHAPGPGAEHDRDLQRPGGDALVAGRRRV